ncbi:hypothetical protein GUJ93_ZPchr0004g38917 [Zizania palustris]|uniref:EF-hand domain-containing protein n=1 Tax=Zizania palustris TaxID=103762 RepID=A0A8J5SD53_ZIZPA|nr:hypothetical protein GUJ93_ZPchr0004g38917 [Zizania palustris]
MKELIEKLAAKIDDVKTSIDKLAPLARVAEQLATLPSKVVALQSSAFENQEQGFLQEMSQKDEKIKSIGSMGFPEDEAKMAITREEEEVKNAKVEHDRKEQLCNISQALAVLASASSVTKERQEFLKLVNKEIELYNTMLEKEGTEDEEARRAYMAAREESDHAAEVAAGEKVSSALIERVDAMLHKLEKEIDDVDARIGNRWQLLDSDRDGKVTPEEVATVANYLKDTTGKDGIQELISNLSKDKEGKILVEVLVDSIYASETARNAYSANLSDYEDTESISFGRKNCEIPIKRVMAESSHQHMMVGSATLDPQRAEAASKHVRALNTQFASWVQSQLQNHPAELWEDGMKDYISHASEIMENFKDVVNWLRQNKTGSTAVSSPSLPNDEKTTSPATVDSKLMVQPGSDNGQKSLFTAASSSAFQNSSSPNLFSFSSQQKASNFTGIFGDKNMTGDSSKQTFLFGANNGFSTPSTPSIFSASGNKNIVGASGDADDDAEPEQPSSPSVKKAEEKGIVVIHEAKCKVYVKHDDATKGWKDIGVGQIKIRCKEGAEKASKESTPTIVIRNDVGKILLNALIYKGIKMNVQKNTVASIFHTSDAQSSESGSDTVLARTYLFRLKNEEEATKLSAAIKENAPTE